MKKAIHSLLSLVLTLTLSAGCICPVLGAGTAQDPVISESYLEQVFGPELTAEISRLYTDTLADFSADTFGSMCQAVAQANAERQQKGTGDLAYAGTARMKQGDVLTLRAGTKLTLTAGTAQTDGWGLIDITAGTALSLGETLPEGHTCMAGQDCTLHIVSTTACFTARGVMALTGSAARDYNSCADGLYALDLFQGTENGYELERSATRIEALVMFLRLLGKEQEALGWTGSHPFTDVPQWADRYVAYAYAKGYTKGVSETGFGSTQPVTARDYLTFLLRALGYTEGTGFTWSSALADSRSLGVITAQEQTLLEQETFLRAHVVWLSWYALFADHQGRDMTLLEALLTDGAVSSADLAGAVVRIVGARK